MKISDIKLNDNNPRFIKDDSFKKLCNSIEKFPKMMKLRPIIIDNNNVILAGNMRYRALKKLGFKELPDNWVKKADELTEEEKKEFIIKDNVGFGSWDYDLLANEWDEVELKEWGLELPIFESELPEIIENDFENSKNPNDIYGGNSIPVRIGTLLAYITDEQLGDSIIEFTEKINTQLNDDKEGQLIRNSIGEKIVHLVIQNKNIIFNEDIIL